MRFPSRLKKKLSSFRDCRVCVSQTFCEKCRCYHRSVWILPQLLCAFTTPPTKTSICIDTNQINCSPNRFYIHSENTLEEHSWQKVSTNHASGSIPHLTATSQRSFHVSLRVLFSFFPAEIRFDLHFPESVA